MGFSRNLLSVLVGIYGIWLIVSSFMVFAFNFQKEAVAMYLVEVKIMFPEMPDPSIVLVGRLIIGGIMIGLGKWMYQSK